MSYTVIKTIKGRRYRYLQTSWREGKRVRTKSVYVGSVDGGESGGGGSGGGVAGFIRAQRLSKLDRALAAGERAAARIDKEQRKMFGETAAERAARERQEALNQLHDRYGLNIGSIDPAPVERGASLTSSPADTPQCDVPTDNASR